MPIADLDSVEFWQNRLVEIQDELSNMVGRPGFEVGGYKGFKVDEKENYDRLTMLKAECEAKLEALGAGTPGTRNVVVGSAFGGL